MGGLPRQTDGLVAWNEQRANGTSKSTSAKGYESYCIFEHLKDFTESSGDIVTWPLPTWEALVTALTSAEFKEYLQDQEKTLGVTRFGYASWYGPQGYSGYEVGGEEEGSTAGTRYVKSAWATFNTTIPTADQLPVSEIRTWHGAWEELVVVSGVDAFALSSWLWGYMALVDALLGACVSGIVISLGVAYAVLIIATSNIIVATIAMTSILGILLSVSLTMVLLGWAVSILESISLIVVVGMSVDFTVHLMHSYRESDEETRFAKARAALTEMGVSVFSGAITTFASACPLLFATFVFFSQFGTFIGVITSWSIIWAIFFLMTFALMVGPEPKAGIDHKEGDEVELYGEVSFRVVKRAFKALYTRRAPDVDDTSTDLENQKVAGKGGIL